jgi:hypothetical protein
VLQSAEGVVVKRNSADAHLLRGKVSFNLSSTRKNIYSGVARKSLKQIEINVKRDVFSALFSWVPYFYASTLAIAW